MNGSVPKLITKKRAAEMLAVSIRTIEREIARGLLPKVRVGRCIRLRIDDVYEYINKRCS